MTDWVELEGTANTRDVGNLPADDGRRTRPHRLLRSDNLQDLSAADVRRLLDDYQVRAVADLRTDVEVASEGPAPLDDRVAVHRLSLFPESGHATDMLVDNDSLVLPWQARDAGEPDRPRLTAVEVYLRYLDDRPDSIVNALRVISAADGATVVHCAAGKDRTGVVVALALEEVGVNRDAVVADYAATAEHGEALIARLAASKTYAADIDGKPASYHLPKGETMRAFLEQVDRRFGGAAAWLRAHGWTDQDAAALREALLSPAP